MSRVDATVPRRLELVPAPEGTPVLTQAKAETTKPEPAKREPAKKDAPRPMPKWESETRERVKVAIRKFGRPLADLVGKDANESSTRMLVTDFLCDGLGFDKYNDLTAEYQVKGDFADYGLRIDQQLIAFIEVKRVTTKLEMKHLRQVEMYAVNEGVEWAILTNAVVWRAYHLTGALPMQVDLALEVDLLSDDPPQHKASQLYYLSRESMKHHQLDELWKAKRATSPKSLAQVLTSDVVIDAIRKELKRQTGHGVEGSDIAAILKKTILRPECFDK